MKQNSLNNKLFIKSSLVLTLVVLSLIAPIINGPLIQQSNPSPLQTKEPVNISAKDQPIEKFINDNPLVRIDSNDNLGLNYGVHLSDIETKQNYKEFQLDRPLIDRKNPFEDGRLDKYYSSFSDEGIIATWSEVCEWAGIHTLIKEKNKIDLFADSKIRITNGKIKMVIGFDHTSKLTKSVTESLLS
ncbi:MAG: hypothetical protein ACFFD2_27030, partial [Promethearchaeota archaeon]